MVECERLIWNCPEVKVPFPTILLKAIQDVAELAGIVSACAEGVEKVDGVTQTMIWIPPANKQKNVQPFNLLTNSLCQQLTFGDTFSRFSNHGLSGGGVSLGAHFVVAKPPTIYNSFSLLGSCSSRCEHSALCFCPHPFAPSS